MAEDLSKNYTQFDYLRLTVDENDYSRYLDCYEAFGWAHDDNVSDSKSMGKIAFHLKRSRKIMNKMELTRLQRHFESCMREIAALEESKHSIPAIASVSCGIVGTALMAGSVFAVTAEPARILLTIVLAVPAFALWFLAWIGYYLAKRRRSRKVEPLIEAKLEEAYEVCSKASKLL